MKVDQVAENRYNEGSSKDTARSINDTNGSVNSGIDAGEFPVERQKSGYAFSQEDNSGEK